MSGACHVDIRHLGGYKNSHWFGDERSGNDNIRTFQRGTKFEGEVATAPTKSKIQLIVDGKTVYSS